MNVELHIERLVLDGLPLTRRQSIVLQDALERELARLLEHRGIAASTGTTVSQLPHAALQLSAGSEPAQWGRQIARALHRGIAGAPGKNTARETLRSGTKPPPASRQPAAQ